MNNTTTDIVRYYRESGYRTEQHGSLLVMTRTVEGEHIDLLVTTLKGCVDLELRFPDTVLGRLAFTAVFKTFTG